MPITIGANIASLRGQRQLLRSSNELASTFERLSSGQRINRASDDAAGLAIAQSLRADARVFSQGIRNFNDGISVFNIADGAIEQLSGIVIRLQELAEQSANGSLSNQQRKALDEEAQALSDEYFRIVQTTEFNGRNLFTADFGELRLQGGYGLEGSIASGLGGAIGTGEFQSGIETTANTLTREFTSGDFNGDGIQDIATVSGNTDSIGILLGNGDGTFQTGISLATGDNPDSVAAADFNSDGILDLVTDDRNDNSVSVLLGNGDGTFQAREITNLTSDISSLTANDYNGDGIQDLAIGNDSDDAISILIGNNNGTFTEGSEILINESPTSVISQDLNNDDIIDLIATGGTEGFILLGNGSGQFTEISSIDASASIQDMVSEDFNQDGILDLITANSNGASSIFLGNGDGTFGSRQDISISTDIHDIAAEDLDGDGIRDLIAVTDDDEVAILIGNGNGTFVSQDEVIESDGNKVIITDFNQDGVLDIGALINGGATSSVEVFLATTDDGISPLIEFSLKTQSDARQALPVFQEKLNQLANQRGEIGAFQSRVQTGINNLTVAAENFRAAESRIKDADIASESANLVRLNILQQAASSVLAQANQQPQLALQLLSLS